MPESQQAGHITQALPPHLRLLTDEAPQQIVKSRSQRVLQRLDDLDARIVGWLQGHGMPLLRYSLGLVFFWFGLLKVIGISPANALVTQTVFWWDAAWFVPALGLGECLIGLCFFHKPLVRLALVLMAGQMVGTFFPFLILPELTMNQTILVPTMEGQYILKNVVLIAGAMVVGAQARD